MIEQFKKYEFLLNAANQAALIAEIHRMRVQYGAKWFEQFKREFPDFVFVVSLIANHTSTDALLLFKEHLSHQIETFDVKELRKHVRIPFVGSFINDEMIKTFAKNMANEFVDNNQTALVNLHIDFRAEIDKPRF